MRALWVWFFLSAVALGASGTGGVVRIMSWNLQNYLTMDRMTAEGYRTAYPKPEAELQALREVIVGEHPDVLLVQEIGGWPELRELRRDLAAGGLEFGFAEVLEAADGERRLGILSRIEPAAVWKDPGEPFPYFGEPTPVKRGLLGISLSYPEFSFDLYTVHLKSRWTDREDDPLSAQRRNAEATVLRDQVLARFDGGGRPYLIAGDINDSIRSAPARRFLARGDRVTAWLVDAADDRGDRWTHHYRLEDSYSRVDLVLVSAAFPPERVVRAWIADGPLVRMASDHRPVLLEVWVGLNPSSEATSTQSAR